MGLERKGRRERRIEGREKEKGEGGGRREEEEVGE